MTMAAVGVPSVGARVAVVGSGIAGLASAWLLAQRFQVTLFESAKYFGGHSNTVDVTLEGVTHPVDTGFLVHNELTYPNLVALFDCLGVPVHASEMSFGVSLQTPDLEWAGSSLSTVFAQPTNVFKPRFLSMLADILRFNRSAAAHLDESLATPMSLGDLLACHRYGRAMQDWYLLPMAAAIWSSSVQDILQFPAATFLQFCLNHRLLQIQGRPQWRTVLGGSRVYVNAMLPRIQDARLNCAVTRVRRTEQGVVIDSACGRETFAAVVMACHAPTSRHLLDLDERESATLAGFRYQSNEAILHVDAALLPRRRKVWSAWNYMAAQGMGANRPVAVSYLINRLQPLPFKTPIVVTLNAHQQPRADAVMARFAYEHPVMDAAADRVQKALPALQGHRQTWYAGAWCGYGFHEDGLKSALRVAQAFAVPIPWEVEVHAHRAGD